MSFVDVLRSAASEFPDKTAFTFLTDGETEAISWTYGELDRRARSIAALLKERGLAGGRVVLLYAPGLDVIAAFFGALYAGSVAVPVAPPDPSRMEQTWPVFLRLIEDCRSGAILTTAFLAGFSGLFREKAPGLATLPWIATDEVRAGLEGAWKPPSVGPDELALLQYTSGSTGTPKGVALSHANLMENTRQTSAKAAHRPEDVYVNWLPLSHNMGLIGCVLLPLRDRIPSVLMSPLAFLQAPLRWPRAISRFGGTIAIAPNFAYDLCSRAATPGDLDGIRLERWNGALTGGEPVKAATIERFVETFGPCGFRRETFYPGLGISEATLLVSVRSRMDPHPPKSIALQAEALRKNAVLEAPEGDDTAVTYYSCGSPIADHEVAIVRHESCERCREDEIGEIWIRGGSVAKGYWEKPGETRETFEAFLRHPQDGPFLRTGDLGFLRQGELYVTGRLKELLIIRGRNHYPQDIEKTAERSDPALTPWCGAAFSVPSEEGERLMIVCELEGLSSGDEDRIAGRMKEALSRWHGLQLHSVAFVAPGRLPKTRSGKIQRLAVKAASLDGSLEGRFPWKNPEEDAPPNVDPILGTIAEALGVPASELNPEAPFAAYGMDSLTAVQLAQRLEDRLESQVLVADLFEASSIRAFLSGRRASARPARGFQPAEAAHLAPDIVPGAPGREGPRSAVLLTGATGFVGAFLLEELLRATPYTVYCTARATDEAEAGRRLRRNLESFSLWKDEYRDRIVPVPGDLAKPRLGLSERLFAELAGSVDAVYHNGALVNFLYPYQDLEAANVEGTREILRLAGAGRLKEIHYVSTLSVFPTAGNPRGSWYREDDDLADHRGLLNGYAQSKWAAEKVLQTAKARGFPIAVYRLGEVLGHSVTGACRPERDAYSCLLKACLESGCAPEFRLMFYPVPVDYAVRAIVHLSGRASSLGRAFHLTHPEPLPHSRLFDLLTDAGFRLRRVGYRDWLAAVAESGDRKIASFLPFLRNETVASLASTETVLLLDCRNTLAALEGSGIHCPVTTLESLSPYMHYLIRTGFLNKMPPS